jgi:glycosyltransferase involved in cell wall biosynthesis
LTATGLVRYSYRVATALRIAFDCSHFAVPGGIRTRIGNMVRALAAAGPDNEYVLYVRGLGRTADVPALPEGSRARVVSVRAPRRLLAFLENRVGWPPLEYWTGPVDVVHGTHFVLPPTRRSRRVLTVHDVAYLRHPEFYADKRWNDYGYRYLLSRSLRRADAVIAISHTTRTDCIELCGVDEEKIWVVPSGVDPRLRPVPAEIRRPVLARLRLDRPYAVYPVGTIDVRKNLPGTLEAFARAFPDSAARPLLVLTGVGALPEDLLARARARGIEDAVRPCHVSYPEEFMAVLSGGRWGMYLSRYEGFGLPPLEAMACGLPLVVSRTASVPEVAGDAAVLVDPTDTDAIAEAMRRLDGDEALRRDLAARGRERAAGPAFSWERAARQTLAVYRNDRSAFLAEPQPLSASGISE